MTSQKKQMQTVSEQHNRRFTPSYSHRTMLIRFQRTAKNLKFSRSWIPDNMKVWIKKLTTKNYGKWQWNFCHHNTITPHSKHMYCKPSFPIHFPSNLAQSLMKLTPAIAKNGTITTSSLNDTHGCELRRTSSNWRTGMQKPQCTSTTSTYDNHCIFSHAWTFNDKMIHLLILFISPLHESNTADESHLTRSKFNDTNNSAG